MGTQRTGFLISSLICSQTGQQTQLLHVFQEQLLTGKMSKGDTASTMEAIVDLRNLGSFEELFYLVVMEKNKDSGSTVHMWKMTIASQAGTVGEGTNMCMLVSDSGVSDSGVYETLEKIMCVC